MTTFILKNGETKQADTSYFSNDILRDTDGNCYYDSEILRVQNDYRNGLCKCNYCGFTSNLEKMEQHFKAEEEKEMICKDCYQHKINIEKISNTKQNIKNGYIQTIVEKVTYIPCDKECKKFEHRSHSYTRLNNKNTFFLAYSNGFNMSDEDIQKITFDFKKKYEYVKVYSEKFGSYELSYLNDKKLFVLENARNKVAFQYDKENENFIVYEEIYKPCKLTVMKKLKERYNSKVLKCNEQVTKFFKERLNNKI